MGLTSFKVIKKVAAILLCAMFLFAPYTQSQTISQSASGTATFDHSKTGFQLKDVHKTLKCEQCHVEGIFKNTPKVCSGCHATGTRVAATPRPINHVPTSSECDACHVSATNFQVKSYNHVGITGGCANCHNGLYLGVVSKSPQHFPTQLPCEACHTNTSSFISLAMSHNGITNNCFTCHGGPAGEPGPIRSYPNVTSYNPSTHVPLTAYGATPPDCNTCHTNFSSFLGANFDHLGVTPGTCGTCHKSQYPNVVSINPATHIGGMPAAACDTCHSGYASFLGATYTHTAGSTCASCHTGQYSGVVSKTPAHIPIPSTSTTCADCHADPASPVTANPTFNGSVFHQTALGNGLTPPTGMTCATCHSGSYVSQNATGKGSAHVTTSSDCVTCHTKANTSSYTTFAGATFSHATVAAGSCGTCHKGQYGGVVSINTSTHIPQSSGNACDTCHTNAKTGLPGSMTPTFNGVIFHQTAQGNPPTGACSTCHSGAYLSQNAQAKNLGHVTTTADCKSCHINTAGYTSFLGASFSHTPGTYATFPSGSSATPKCSTCHNGTNATGKAPTHVVTTGDCLVCHTTSTTGCPNCTTFLGAQYDHSNATTGVAAYTVFPAAGSTPTPRCDSCHGSTALGKNAGHVPTTADCMTCHTPSSTGCGSTGLCSTFLGATFSHTGIATGTCGTCHQGQYSGVVSINPSRHIPQSSGNACDTCHTAAISRISTTTPTFLGVVFHKSTLGNPPSGTCSTCHSGAYTSENALGKNPGHVTTASDCVLCHTASNTASYTSFLGASFSHSGTYPVFPTGSTATPRCDSCHNGTTATGKVATHVSTTGDCLVCHTTSTTGCPNCSTFYGVQYDHTNATTGVAAYTTFPVTGSTPSPRCDSCHNGSTALGKNALHVPTTSDCMSCHTPASTGCGTTGLCSTFLGATFSHAGIAAGTCGTCHQGQYAGVVSINAAVHIPQSSGNACDTCHTNAKTGLPGSTTPTFLGVVFHKTTLGNPPSGTCTSCHSGAYLSENALAKNTGHVTTTSDCVVCHTATNTASYTSFLGANFSHSPGTYATFPTGTTATPTCSSCHNGATATGKVSTHVVTSGDCLVCHVASTTGCPNCTTFFGVQYDHSSATTGVAAYTTFPVAGSTPSPRCDSCHGSTALGKSASHVPTTADCITCHTPANTGCGTTGLCSTFLGATFNHTGIAAGSCGTCHKGQYASVVSINTSVHIPQSSGNACDACHTNALTGLPSSPTPTFNGVVFHQNSLGNPPTGTCTSCHSGAYVSQNAQAKISGHVTTTADCVSCHTASNTGGYTTFLGAAFSHSPGTYASFPATAPASPKCSSCHNGTTAKGKSAGHMTTTADCINCHTNGSTGCPNCSTFLGAAAPAHTVANGFVAGTTCVSCHNGTTATGLSANPSHIPIGGIDCGQCHAAYDGAGSTNFSTSAIASGMYAGVSKYTMNHTGLTGTCGACHNGSYASQGVYGAQGKVTNHIPTTIVGSADCTSCHKKYLVPSNFAITGGVSMWQAPGNETMNHNNAQGGAPNYCVTCHLTGTTYLVPSGFQRKSHNGTSTAKDCSKSSCHKPIGSIGTSYSAWN